MNIVRSLIMKGSYSLVTTIFDSIQIAQVLKSNNFVSVHMSSVYYECTSDWKEGKFQKEEMSWQNTANC